MSMMRSSRKNEAEQRTTFQLLLSHPSKPVLKVFRPAIHDVLVSIKVICVYMCVHTIEFDMPRNP